jgi:hypothetical protein
MKKGIGIVILLCLVFSSYLTVPAFAETNEDDKKKTNMNLTALAIHQFNTNLDNGGDVSVNRYFVHFDWKKIINVHYNLNDYSFSDTAPLLNSKTLEKVHSLGLDIGMMFKVYEEWRLVLVPSIEFSGESGAEWSDSLIYGGIVAAVNRYPIIIIDWKITEKLRLSNPLPAGPSGPAGLELSYEINKNWETGFGGAYRSFRYRLSDEGVVSKGIFQDRSVPVWGRLSWKHASRLRIDFNAGAFVFGHMKIENQEGNDIRKDNYDASPFVALTISLNF